MEPMRFSFKAGTVDRSALYVQVETTWQEGRHQTTEHQWVDGLWRLSIQGEVQRSGHPMAFGQTIDVLQDIISRGYPSPLYPTRRLVMLRDLWRDWHLNDMDAGCAHQAVVYEDLAGRRPSLDLTEPCPLTGYRYGTAWLARPLTEAVLADLKTLEGFAV